MKLVVGISGGVDSADALARLKNDGHEVLAATLIMRKDLSPSPEALARAQRTCEALGVTHVIRDVSNLFQAHVLEHFCDAYVAGATPSPCVQCNRNVKIKTLIDIADEYGFDKVATGHYVRLVDDGGVTRIARAFDLSKDQSYFLCELTSAQIERLWAPLANVTKAETRAHAKSQDLEVATAAESQGLCFVDQGNYRTLLAEERPGVFCPGNFVDQDGTIMGTHPGSAHFTIGQRKGIGLAGGPWFVTAIDAATNTVTIRRNKPEPVHRFVVAASPSVPTVELLQDRGAQVQTRYRSPLESVTFKQLEGGAIEVSTESSTLMCAPGQTCAFYAGDIVLGGGTVESIKYN